MHRVIHDHLQLQLIGATASESALLEDLLRDQPQIALIGESPSGSTPLSSPHADAILICADRRGSAPAGDLPCLWLLRQPPSQPATDELALAGISGVRLLRLLALLIDQQRAADRLAQLTLRDPLTGLAAPKNLTERIARLMHRAEHSGDSCALLYIALDPSPTLAALDAANRDELLAQMGAAIADCVDERQLAVRLDDSEFLVAVSGNHQPTQLAALARRLLRQCRLRGERQRHEWQVTVSIGIAATPGDGTTADKLLARARTAAHQCAERGGDNFSFVDADQDQLAHELAQLQSELGHALLRNEIELRYQPLFDMRRRAVVALEVLLRWQHPRLGLLAPRYFLDLARASGAIHPLGSWVLRKACEQRRQWQAEGAPPLALTFNIERRQLQHGALLGCVQQLIEEGELASGAIGVEIAEAELAECDSVQTAQLEALSARGVQLAVDHFSGRHCTVAQLQRLPLRALKLDHRRLAASDGDGSAALERTLRLCRALRCDAIAAGVEKRRSAAWLRSRDCDAIQGFAVSRPLTAEELPRWLQQVARRS